MDDASRFFATVAEKHFGKSDAELYGLDIAKVKRERFEGDQHWAMLRHHRKNVRRFLRIVEGAETLRLAQVRRFERLEAKLATIPDSSDSSQNSDGYRFTDKQMEIALRSLGRND